MCWDQLASRDGVGAWADFLGARTEEGKKSEHVSREWDPSKQWQKQHPKVERQCQGVTEPGFTLVCFSDPNR